MIRSPDNFIGIILSLFSNCVQYIDLRDHFYFFILPILIFIRHDWPLQYHIQLLCDDLP
jgi:Mg2+/citrate symporter